jgi:DNA-binding PadR family transcriptional regulator
MTKLEVLRIFAQVNGFLKPDYICGQLHPVPDRRSLYSYLGRLRDQGLLDRHPNSRRGHLTYRLTERGRARLEYLRRKLQRQS